MSEGVLNALMHLFAVFANINQNAVSGRKRNIVETYLKIHLKGKNIIRHYLDHFDENLVFYNNELKELPDDSGITFQIKNICKKISRELHRNERMTIFISLLEFVIEDGIVTEKENEFVDVVAESLMIGQNDLAYLKSFIFHDKPDDIASENLLIIENFNFGNKRSGSAMDIKASKILQNDHLDGSINILFISGTQSFILKYFGEDRLLMEGKRIHTGRTYLLNEGSIIKGIPTPIYFHDIASQFLPYSRENEIILAARDIQFFFDKSENGIQKFSFCESSGQLIGIMGVSGTGKSTLLNILNGNLLLNQGDIYINGYHIYKDKKKLEGVIGFVPQDDLLIEELTVFQNVYFNALLCFDLFSKKQIAETVINILVDLDLYDIRNLKVGNPLNKFISGGQRKRLNIGIELMREPAILFIDEPTSGLSSADSEMVIQLLKKQVQKGKLIIANIHQPSSAIFKMLDKIWVLDRGGYPIYTGNPIDAIVYFRTMSYFANSDESECSLCGNVNPDQILQIVEMKAIDETGKYTRRRKVTPEKWYELYKEHIESKVNIRHEDKILPDNSFKIPGIFKQFRIFSRRNLLSKLTNLQFLLISLLEAPVLAFILGYFTKYMTGSDVYVFGENKNLPVYFFMSVVVSLFLGLTISAEEIIKDRKILGREKFLNLSRFSYLNSKIVFLFFLSALQSLLFVIIGNHILEIKWMNFPYWFILFTTSCFANMMGLNISSGLNSVITIYITIPLILVPQIILGGAMIRFDDLHSSLTSKTNVPLIGDLMTSRWSYEALMVYQFLNNPYERIFCKEEQIMSYASYRSSYLIPNLQEKLEQSNHYRMENISREETERMLHLVRNEITKLSDESGIPGFEFINYLSWKTFSPEIAEETNGYLYYLKMNFIEEYNKANAAKQKKIIALLKKMGAEKLENFKQAYYNKQVANMLLNRNEMDVIFETSDRLIQKKDPVFLYTESTMGRSHFFAPGKNIYGLIIPTFWFNTLTIWFMTAILYLTLLFNLLREITLYFSIVRLRKMGRLLQINTAP